MAVSNPFTSMNKDEFFKFLDDNNINYSDVGEGNGGVIIVDTQPPLNLRRRSVLMKDQRTGYANNNSSQLLAS